MRTSWKLAAMMTLGVTALTGCAQQSPQATTPEVTPSSTASPTPEAPERPANRYGIACDDLVDTATLTEIFGEKQPFRISHHSGLLGAEPLVQDGALLCKWGTDDTLDGPGSGLEVLAVPYAKAIEPALRDLQPSDYRLAPTSISLAGTDVEERCTINDGPPATKPYCDHVLFAEDTLVTFQLGHLGDADVSAVGDVTPGERSRATLEPGSKPFTLLESITERIASAIVLPAPTPAPLASCAELVPWDDIAAQLQRPLNSVDDFDAAVDYSKGDRSTTDRFSAARKMAASIAAEDQGVRRCSVQIGDDSEATRPFFVSTEFVPEGSWVRETGIWRRDWDAEICADAEGGKACSYAWMSPSGVAAHVRVGGGEVSDDGPKGITELIEKALP